MFYKTFPWEGLDPSPPCQGGYYVPPNFPVPPPPPPKNSSESATAITRQNIDSPQFPTGGTGTALVLVRTPIRNSISRVECLLCRSGVQCTAPPPDIETMHHAHAARERRCDNVAVSWAARPTKPALTSHLISPSFLRNTDFVTREVAPLNCNILSNNRWSIGVELR